MDPPVYPDKCPSNTWCKIDECVHVVVCNLSIVQFVSVCTLCVYLCHRCVYCTRMWVCLSLTGVNESCVHHQQAGYVMEAITKILTLTLTFHKKWSLGLAHFRWHPLISSRHCYSLLSWSEAEDWNSAQVVISLDQAVLLCSTLSGAVIVDQHHVRDW